MNAQQRAVVHEQIESLAAAEERLRVARLELEQMLIDDAEIKPPLLTQIEKLTEAAA